MKKFFLLTSIICLCCFVATAQQENDSTKENISIDETGSLFSNFSYTFKDDNKILLQWQADSISVDEYFVIEKSEDGNNFETIGAIKKSSDNIQYEVADNTSISGYNFYRIKYIDKTGKPFYSKSLQISTSKNFSLKFYPNPVDKLLIVETEYPMNMQVLNSLGVMRLNVQLHQGLQVIDVSTLDRGTYILRIIDNDHNRNILQQLVKN
ncbi:MAG TPA: T9SS type A sorting domain-containing protein [Puia sp.]|jgi:hypothetical protein|nr:T9SS type A sorting domain-containing protein [Puia sp.]